MIAKTRIGSLIGKNTNSHSWWLLAAVILGDGLFVVLQVPSPSFLGFGLTPIPLLLAETLAYLLGGYLVYRLGVLSNKVFYYANFIIVVVVCLVLAFAPVPGSFGTALQLLVYISLALLNLGWGVCFSSFRPSVSVVLVVGAYVLWGIFSFCISITVETQLGDVLQVVFPFVSLVLLGFCLKKLNFGINNKQFSKQESRPGFLSVFRSVGFLFSASLAFAFIFGSIMEIDVLLGNESFIASPEAQIGSVFLCLAMLIYVLATGAQFRYRLVVIVVIALATILMWRAIFQSNSFFTSGLPMIIFNFFGMIVWIVFAWQAFESKVNSFCIFALGLGSMRLGLLGGRCLAIVLKDRLGLSWEVVRSISILGLWILFICVLLAVWFILKRQRSELLPFESETKNSVIDSSETENTPLFNVATSQTSGLHTKLFEETATVSGLTEREREILLMYASGRSAVYIAEELYLSNYTVKTHLRRSYAKLGIHTRQELLDLIWKEQGPEDLAKQH